MYAKLIRNPIEQQATQPVKLSHFKNIPLFSSLLNRASSGHGYSLALKQVVNLVLFGFIFYMCA